MPWASTKGEGLFHLLLGVSQLDVDILKLFPAGDQPFFHTAQQIVQTEDVAENVCAQAGGMGERPFQGDSELLGETLKGQFHSEAPVLAQGNRIGAGHSFAGGEDGAACRFFVSVDGALHLHGGKAVLVGMGVLFQPVYVGGVALNALFQGHDFLRQILDDLILQGIPLAQMIGFQQLQPLYVDVQIHLLFDMGIAGAKGLDFSVGQGGFVNILQPSAPGFCWS